MRAGGHAASSRPALVVGVWIAAVLMAAPTSARADKVKRFKLASLDGASLDSQQLLSGKAAVIAFWRVDHRPSSEMLDELESLHKRYAKSGVRFVTVLSGRLGPVERERLRRRSRPFPILLDPTREVYGAFHVIVYPTVFFVDSRRERRFAYSGHAGDFEVVAGANLDFLLGRIDARQREARVTPGDAPKVDAGGPGRARYKLGQKLLASGKRRMAMKQFEQAWKSKPPQVDGGVDLALMKIADGKALEASRLLEAVLATAPGHPRATAARGVALIRAGRVATGRKLLDSTLARHRLAEPLFHFELGLARRDAGDKAGALRAFRKALGLVVGGP